MNLNMLEITSKKCYKCDLETIIGSNGVYFWINLRDFKVETESKWLNPFTPKKARTSAGLVRNVLPFFSVTPQLSNHFTAAKIKIKCHLASYCCHSA